MNLLDVHSYISKIIENDRLFVSKSILGEFNGLFAKKVIEKGEIVCVYTGKKYRTVEAIRIPASEKDYLMRLGEQSYVDAKYCPHVIARYINDCRNPKGYNVIFEKLPSEGIALVIALRDIMPYEEVFVDYGKWYWFGKKPVRLLINN